MRVRERKRLHRGRKGHHGRPINKTAFSLSGARKGDASEPMVVSKYTQTRQMWLKDKIVNLVTTGTIRRPLLCPKQGSKKQGKNTKEK